MGIPAPRRALGIALALGLGLAPLAAGGQTYPDRSIRLIVATAAGGASDILARQVGQKRAKPGASRWWWTRAPAPTAT